jgi:hypothetical protein
MWTRIECSRCRNTFASVGAFLAHTHTAGDGAVADPRPVHRADPGACTAATIDAADSILANMRTVSRRDLHRVRVHGLGRSADQLRRGDKIT